MAKVRLTTRFIDTVKVDVRTDYHDTLVQGLTLRVAPTGTKTWNPSIPETVIARSSV